MKEVYIVRHGNTFDKGDIVTRVGARTDLPLSLSGQGQAAALGEHFQALSFKQAFSSSLLRTQETAHAILAAQNNQCAIETLEFLKEIDYGQDENRPEQDVAARLGQEAINAWDQDCIVPQGWGVDPEAIIQSWRLFFKNIMDSDREGPILLVTSNGIARFALLAMTEPVNTKLDKKLKTAAYGKVLVSEMGQTRITEWNRRP